MGDLSLSRTLEHLRSGRRRGLHLGAQIFVVRHDEVLADEAVGEARPGVALTRDSVLLWLSTSKPIAAVAIAQLWELDRLDLDDRVADHIPAFAAGGKGPITIRHLLTHTAGFRHLAFGWPEASWDEIIANLCALRLEPRWVPGEKAGYHLSSSWFILGELIRRLSGRPFSAYVREEIFEPLGMSDCWIGVPTEQYYRWGDRLSPMWNTEKEPPSPHRWTDARRLTRPMPGGNGVGPAAQLGRFYRMLIEKGTLQGKRILRSQTVEALTARHRAGLHDQTFKSSMDWGLGFIPNSHTPGAAGLPYHYGRHASRRAFGHSGNRSSTAFCDPAHGLVVVVLTNGTPSESAHRQRMNELLETLYEELGLARSE